MSPTPSRPLGSGQSRRTDVTRPSEQSRSGATRPGTARPQTAASTRHEGSYVIALLESRGVAHEVGIAAMDRDTGRVMLVQVGSELCIPQLSSRLCRLTWVVRFDLSWQTVRRMSRRCIRCTFITLRSFLSPIRSLLSRMRRWHLAGRSHQPPPYWSSLLWKSFLTYL